MGERDIKEDELAGLDQEIDQAIDSLFVEKGGEEQGPRSPSTPSTSSEPSGPVKLDAVPPEPAVMPSGEGPEEGGETLEQDFSSQENGQVLETEQGLDQ
ncbi:MAG: hypothetical protein JRH07_15925, partial [Deltaproteobacteria bacterium]|nr:hypothetical protein [Deltaproteobacteria bacterium]